MIVQAIGELRHGLVHLFYPQLCEGCRKPLLAGEEVLCIACGLQMPETGYHHIESNETALRFAGRVPFSYATSLAYFTNNGLLQHLLHGLKYHNRKEIGRYLGRKLGYELKQTSWGSSIDIIVPIPLHKTKKAMRGYNQSMLIAEGISEVLKVPASDNILQRVRNTETQTKKSRVERVKNMEQAFQLKQKGTLAGKHILLCDDILTTGATIEACALELMKEENVRISIATIGIAIS